METFINYAEIIQTIFIVPFLYIITVYIFKKLKKRHSFFDIRLMKGLFFYHLAFGGAYYIYALFNRSDSRRYFSVPQKEGK